MKRKNIDGINLMNQIVDNNKKYNFKNVKFYKEKLSVSPLKNELNIFKNIEKSTYQNKNIKMLIKDIINDNPINIELIPSLDSCQKQEIYQKFKNKFINNYFSKDLPKIFNLEDIKNIKNENLLEFDSYPLNVFFNKYQEINIVQKLCLKYFYSTNEDLLLKQSNGCSKNFIFNFAIARVFRDNYNYSENKFFNKKFRIIYILNSTEKCKRKYEIYKNNCSKIFNEQNIFSEHEIKMSNLRRIDILKKLLKANLILTTPEYLEYFTRKFNILFIKFSLYKEISLILIDSLHNINNIKNNGIYYENIILRFNFLKEKYKLNFRFISSIPKIDNLKEIGMFLNIENKNILLFPEQFDFVKTNYQIIPYSNKFDNDSYENMLLDDIPNILNENIKTKKQNHRIILICSSDKYAEESCEFLKNKIDFLYDEKEKVNLEYLSKHIQDRNLQDLFKHGLCFNSKNFNDRERNWNQKFFKSSKSTIKILKKYKYLT